MINPLVKYKSYHTNKVNVAIHQLCIPLLLMSFYSVFPLYLSFVINAFYSTTYLLFDVFSKKSIHSVYYLQSVFVVHLIFRNFLSSQTNIYIHIGSWVLQIVGHKFFEQNTPAFLDNFYDSFLFAPYFTFLETFYPESFEIKEKYTIIKPDYDESKKSILYFAGLFQHAQFEYKDISNDLSSYNHIYINTYFVNNDIYKNTLIKIIEELKNVDIECIIGFSFGGSLTLQFKELYFETHNKEIKSILISPGGFKSDTILEKTLMLVSKYLYFLYCNDKWYIIQNYPIYQNRKQLSTTDYIIVSTDDNIHNPIQIKSHQNSIILNNASHSSMIKIIKKQNIIKQLIKSNYSVETVVTKPLNSAITKLLFGGHFYPYHITFWLSVSGYNLYHYIQNEYSYSDLAHGFVCSSFLYSLLDYFFHYLLHKAFYTHHKKHHVYPNKLSIIHSSALLVITFIYLLSVPLSLFLSKQMFHFAFVIGPLYYLSFETTHLLSHGYKGSNNIILNAKYFHKLHHIEENTNFGFITPFWDYMFGTISSRYNMSFIELLFGFIPFYSFFAKRYQNE